MDERFIKTRRAADSHFWFHGFRRFLGCVLADLAGGRTDLRIVDCGCGMGQNLPLLAHHGFILFNAEYYLDIARSVRALAFHDAGQAFAEGQSIDLRQLRTSTGVELRVFIPMLNVPLRLIHAWNIYRDAFQPARAFKVAVGTTF